jgi:TPR repeat protein
MRINRQYFVGSFLLGMSFGISGLVMAENVPANVPSEKVANTPTASSSATTSSNKSVTLNANQQLITPQLEDGQAAFNTGNYDLAFSLWQTRATQGHSDAQVFVGLSYANGWGVDKNTKLAGHWYQKAAKNDNASGQFLLGIYLISGKGSDLPKGVMWLRRAAENGDASAKGFLKKAKRRGWFDKMPQIREEKNNKVETIALAENTQ